MKKAAHTKECSREYCKQKTYSYRDLCFKCKPKRLPGRKSLGKRKNYTARLSQKQQKKLKEEYNNSIQNLVDSILTFK